MMNLEDVKTMPTESGIHKIILLEINEQPRLLFAHNKCHPLHHGILGLALKNENINYPKQPHHKFPHIMIPVPKYEGAYNTLMMGIASIDLRNKQSLFEGASGDYGFHVTRQYYDVVSQLMPDWKIFIKES